MSPQDGRMEDTEMQHWLTWCTMVDGEPLRSTHSEQYIDGAWTLDFGGLAAACTRGWGKHS